MKCLICGKELTGRQKRYCSKRCRNAPIDARRLKGGDLYEKFAAQKAEYQRTNRNAEGYKREERQCKWCGKTFMARKDAPLGNSCSIECREALKQEGKSRKLNWRQCPQCGVSYFKGNPAMGGAVCSSCGPICKLPWRDCVDCGRPFIFSYGGYPRCKECTEKRGPTGRWHVSKTRRKKIYERDSWTCQICGEPIDQDVDPQSDWAVSLDHIIPRVHGGTHEDTNLRTAHRWCNSVVSHHLYYQDDIWAADLG